MTTLQYANNEELVLQYQNGDDHAFTELFENNQGLIREVMKSCKNIKAIDQDTLLSACYSGFMTATKYYRINMNMKFSTYCIRAMKHKINDEINYIKRNDRYTMFKNSESINITIENSYGQETEVLWLLDVSETEDYFEDDKKKLINNAIQYALSKNTADFKEYFIPILHGEITQTEVSKKFNTSKQLVEYHLKRFRTMFKKYLAINKSESIESILG